MKAKASGVDYLSMRADGRTDLHIHVALGVVDPAVGELELRENARLHSSAAEYRWLNAING